MQNFIIQFLDNIYIEYYKIIVIIKVLKARVCPLSVPLKGLCARGALHVMINAAYCPLRNFCLQCRI